MEKTSFWQSNFFKIAVFFIGMVVLAAALAPPLYWGGKHVVAEGWIKEVPVLDSIHGSMDRAKFTRYFNRAVLLGGALMLWPTIKWMSGGQKGVPLRERFQLTKNRRWWRHLLIGFALAAIPLLLLGWFYVSKGWYVSKDTTKTILSILTSALITGCAVGFLEEFVFRGALTSLASKILSSKVTLLVIAIIFAAVHFLKPPQNITDVTAWSGFKMLGLIFSQFKNPHFLAAEFAVLFMIGLVLGYTRLKTGSLWLAIGLHAGWVFGVKTLSPLSKRGFAEGEMMPWLGDSLAEGLVSCALVAVTGVVVWFWLRKYRYDDTLA
ncbi:MAG: CPBP family intramembrane glutamic endopeptidase [Verrucomicrobiota bacterium]